jgi:hypothetical protein
LVPILSQLNPLYTLPANLPKIHSDPILLSMPQSSDWALEKLEEKTEKSVPCII